MQFYILLFTLLIVLKLCGQYRVDAPGGVLGAMDF